MLSARKTIFAIASGALLAASAPAFADHDRGWHRGHSNHRGPDRVVVERRVPAPAARRVVVERPVHTHRSVVVAAPAPVYPAYEPVYHSQGYEPWTGYAGYPGYPAGYATYPAYEPVYQPPVAYPAPVYYEDRTRVNPVGAIAGAAIGAAIGSQVGDYHSRGATTAIGAVLGGVLGSQF